MRKKLTPEKFIIILGLLFSVILVLVNVFWDFVPHTVKTEKAKTVATEFSTYSGDSVENTTSVTTSSEMININTATVQELCTLNMIGETKAEAIVNYREKYGLFEDKSDILNVYGIGEKTYEKIKDNICVE